MIFILKRDFQNTYSLLIDNVELGTKMPTYRPRFFAKPRLQEWVMPEASFYYGENFEGMRETLPDVSNWATGVLVFNPKAYEVFKNYLAKSGEFLPISISGETHYLFNTLYVIPDSAIDKSKAVEVIDTGVHLGQTNVIFDESFLGAENILVFKSDTNKLMHSFCTAEFKKLYEENGFKGLTFEPVFNDKG
jgi:hypothetical protein